MAADAPKAKFDYKPHPHIAGRKKLKVSNSDEILSEVGPRTINQKLGLAITKRVGTMWAAYIFFGLTKCIIRNYIIYTEFFSNF